MTKLVENYNELKKELDSIQLVSVSKNNSADKIKELYDNGVRIFAENKVQELLPKYYLLPKDIKWHFIGHLQTNKVKSIIEFIDIIESVDTEKLLLEISKQSVRINKITKILLEVKIADEETKYGFNISEIANILNNYKQNLYKNINIKGFMAMATYTNDNLKIKNEFEKVKNIFDEFKNEFNLDTLSIGMSNDYKIAIQNGATSVRIGSAIFKDN